MNSDYIFHHVEQSVRLMRGDGAALSRMDITTEGFWRSFAAFLVSLPALFFIWVISAKLDQAEAPELSLGGLIATDAIIELAVWIIPIVVLAGLLNAIGYRGAFAQLIIARNWAMVAVNYLIALIMVPELFAAGVSAGVGLALLVALIIVIAGITNLTRLALQSGWALAAALVIGEFVISTVVLVSLGFS